IRNGIETARKMMIPPIVGVPAFSWWPSGPSSRMNWPNSRVRRNEMNFGDRKMQMSSAAVPAMRTSPISARLEGVGADLRVEAPLVGAELQHVAEDGDATARGGRGELVECGAHRHRVRVVAVVHDDD